ncbi:MAG TPA: hypothetical protein VN260_05345 [Dissulfurispiraceae bacterium]|nr:hypothetical protein [Dissulfurispiraceae bacterium]
MKLELMTIVNLAFCVVILLLGLRRYRQSGVRAFIFIGLGFLMYGVSHFSLLMGWDHIKTALVAVRSAGYILVILGLLV